jgi:hypothetical protein
LQEDRNLEREKGTWRGKKIGEGENLERERTWGGRELGEAENVGRQRTWRGRELGEGGGQEAFPGAQEGGQRLRTIRAPPGLTCL